MIRSVLSAASLIALAAISVQPASANGLSSQQALDQLALVGLGARLEAVQQAHPHLDVKGTAISTQQGNVPLAFDVDLQEDDGVAVEALFSQYQLGAVAYRIRASLPLTQDGPGFGDILEAARARFGQEVAVHMQNNAVWHAVFQSGPDLIEMRYHNAGPTALGSIEMDALRYPLMKRNMEVSLQAAR